MFFDPNTITDEASLALFIEQCFSQGYVPMAPRVVRYSEVGKIEMTCKVQAMCAYAGKKMARKIGVQTQPNIISFYPPILPPKKGSK